MEQTCASDERGRVRDRCPTELRVIAITEGLSAQGLAQFAEVGNSEKQFQNDQGRHRNGERDTQCSKYFAASVGFPGSRHSFFRKFANRSLHKKRLNFIGPGSLTALIFLTMR